MAEPETLRETTDVGAEASGDGLFSVQEFASRRSASDGENGRLTLLGRKTLQTNGPTSGLGGPSGQHLYVTSDKTDAVTTLKLGRFQRNIDPQGLYKKPG